MRSTFRDRRMAPVAVAVIALVAIWFLPDVRSDPTDVGLAPVEAARGVVLEIDPETLDPNQDVEPAGSNVVRVRVLDGPRAGEELTAFVALPFTQATAADFEVGDEVVVTFTQQPDGPAFVSVAERWRLPVIGILVLLFAATIILVGGWQGLRALLALSLTIAVVVKLLVPAILQGLDPVLLAIVIAGAITVATIVLTEGMGRLSLAAILGTVAGLAITGLVSTTVGLAAGLSGSAAGELFAVEFPSGGSLDTRGLLLAAIIIGAVGVLDDMTVTQAAAVRELSLRPGMSTRARWEGGLRIGRSHVAATVNTLFMAYVGASLPALVFLVVTSEPTILTLNREVLALEVVRTLAGGLGIVLAMPLTTAIAIAIMGSRPAETVSRPAERQRRPTASERRPAERQRQPAETVDPARVADGPTGVPAEVPRRRPRSHGMRRRGGPRGPREA